MPKNNKLIQAYKAIHEMEQGKLKQEIDDVCPMIYSSFAIALKRIKSFDYEDIAEIVAESERIYKESANDRESMFQKCYEETGIEFQLRK